VTLPIFGVLIGSGSRELDWRARARVLKVRSCACGR